MIKGCFLRNSKSIACIGLRFPVALLWALLHAMCCLVPLILGVRSAHLLVQILSENDYHTVKTDAVHNRIRIRHAHSVGSECRNGIVLANSLPLRPSAAFPRFELETGRRRVDVGRHKIRIRPWPHPDPLLVLKSYHIMQRLQQEQAKLKPARLRGRRRVIVVTPTYRRTFQAFHLNGLAHTLMLLPPGETLWIVVEAGGVSDDTASLLAQWRPQISIYHISFTRGMPASTSARQCVEAQMRVEGQRLVREQKLDGIVVFGDESNSHTMELFEEIQGVEWMAAFSIGILRAPFHMKQCFNGVPVQGPACNSSGHLVGWHTFDLNQNSALTLGGPLRTLQWAGFALNARMVWKDGDVPDWVRDWDEWTIDTGSVGSPLSMLKDGSHVEPLGRCGRNVLLWWLRCEARADSKFSSRWIIKPPLEVVVPSKNTPWLSSLREQSPHQSVYMASDMSANMRKHTGNYGKASKLERNFRQINRRKQERRK